MFYKKKSMANQPPERPLDELLLWPPEGDFENLRNVRETTISVRMPKAAAEEASRLAEQYLQSQAIVIRNALIIHVYGRMNFDRLVLHGMLGTPQGYVAEVVDPKRIQIENIMSAAAFAVDALPGRASVPSKSRERFATLRIEVPTKLKRDLQKLSKRAGQPLSEYCRGVLTRYYLGALAA